MSYDKAFETFFKTKNSNNFTSKGIWIIRIELSEKNNWEFGNRDFETLCKDIDLSNWYQVRDLSDLQVMQTRRLNQGKEILKVTKSSLVING